MKGTVYLVGAGPGDPGLLTVKALALLKEATMVAYDALISPSILSQVNPQAELLSVGYRGHGSSKLQYQMHPLIIERALAGINVVRLKSGDPWIFGRAAQECEELRERDIPYEVIPGITAGLGAAVYAGFPLTHKENASDVILTSGHDLASGRWKDGLALSGGTLVTYMAASKVALHCEQLIRLGRSPETPAAFIANATRGSQKIVTGTLLDLSLKVGEVERKHPALIIVGKTVALREKYFWWERKPLHHLTLLLVRARTGESRMAHQLRRLGADVLEAPWVEALPFTDADHEQRQRLDTCIKIKNKGRGQILFSCEDGINFFWKRALELGVDVRNLSQVRFGAIGEGVAESLKKMGINPDLVLNGSCKNALEKEKLELRREKNIVITSSSGRKNLKSFMDQLEIPADFIPAYRIQYKFPSFTPPQVDYVILPCTTGVQLLLGAEGEGIWTDNFKNTPMIAMGPLSEKRARDLGAVNVLMTSSDDMDGVLSLLRSL